jgi:hypothetical protein
MILLVGAKIRCVHSPLKLVYFVKFGLEIKPVPFVMSVRVLSQIFYSFMVFKKPLRKLKH